MSRIKSGLIVLILFSFGLTGLKAQQAVPVAGGEASGVTGSASYTVGQIVATSNSGINGQVNQGVQQPYNVTITKGLENAGKLGIECFIYPNPVTDKLKLRVSGINETEFSTLSYRLISNSGDLLQINRIIDNESIITVKHLSRASYYLQIFNQKKLIVEFTIIKN